MEPAIERMRAGGWLKEDENPFARDRFAGAMTRHWTAAGETPKDHVYVTGRAAAILFVPRERLFGLEEKVSSSKKARELLEEATGDNPLILGVLHSDVPIVNVDVQAEPPPEDKKKRDPKKPQAPFTKRGSLPAGSYVLGGHFGKVGLFKRNLELAAFLPGAKMEDKNLKKDEAPPASTILVEPDADLVSKCSFWIGRGGKTSKPDQGFKVSFLFETEKGALDKAGSWEPK
jgi:hypothetical protein